MDVRPALYSSVVLTGGNSLVPVMHNNFSCIFLQTEICAFCSGL